MFEKVSYDQIYDEHIFMFSATSVKKIFNLFDFELIDIFIGPPGEPFIEVLEPDWPFERVLRFPNE